MTPNKKFKILYAAGNNSNAKLQLTRFRQVCSEDFSIKIAAFKKSSPIHLNIDFTLDCIENIFTHTIKEKNFYLERFHKMIKNFSPDLIVSDLEFYSSFVGKDLGIPVWQVSSALVSFGIDQTSFSRREHIDALNVLNRFSELEREKEILKWSAANFVCSHFGDLKERPPLLSGFQWIRPYHFLGEVQPTCERNVVAGILHKNRKLFSFLKQLEDVMIFADFEIEGWQKLFLKRMQEVDDYVCNLKNCGLFVSEGQTSILADCFYNGKFPLIIPDQFDSECILNAWLTEKLGLGKIFFSSEMDDFEKLEMKEIEPNYRSDVQFLHQKLEMIA